MNLEPLSDRIIVRPLPVEEKVGHIILPDSAKEKPSMGIVLAVGTGKLDDKGQHIQPSLAVDDTVLYGKYSGTEITIEGEESPVLIMRENDVFARIKK